MKHHHHDCEECVFLGTFSRLDIYVCGKNSPRMSVLARCGSEPGDYRSACCTQAEWQLKVKAAPHCERNPVFMEMHAACSVLLGSLVCELAKVEGD